MTAVPAMGKTLYRPVRPTMHAAAHRGHQQPGHHRQRAQARLVAETPSTNCMNVGRNVNAPSIANPTTKDSTQHTVNTGLANSRIGRIGSAARLSTHTNAASATTEPTNRPMITGEPHAYLLPPQLVARVRPEAPRPTSTMPV